MNKTDKPESTNTFAGLKNDLEWTSRYRPFGLDNEIAWEIIYSFL